MRGGLPTSWGRATELAATTGLFESNTTTPIPPAPVCRRVYFDLQNDELTWIEVPVPATASTPAEVRYTTTVSYASTFEMEAGQTYVNPPNSKVQLTVREVEGVWHLVECRDLGEGLLTSAGNSRAAGTQSRTLGAMKSLYAGFTPLTSKSAVLDNLESAWNQRFPDQVDELLDDNFAFYFSPGDVGGNIPEQWDRATELATSTALFISNTTPTTGPVCISVQVDIQSTNPQWIAVVPEVAPEETWYTTTLVYSFTFEMDPGQTYSSAQGAKAQFTVRNAGTDGAPDWRLVEWRDLGGLATFRIHQTASSRTATWGAIKALYR